jgi:hypothetical protein
MRAGETELEMVQRHVRESEARIIRQREIVAKLPAGSDLLLLGESLLADLEDALRQHKAHLARIEARGGVINILCRLLSSNGRWQKVFAEIFAASKISISRSRSRIFFFLALATSQRRQKICHNK